VTGVGAGNFWESWGYDNEFRGPGGEGTLGAHNSFFQVTLYWGMVGLLGLCVLIWQAYRCLPKQCGEDSLTLCLVGIAMALLLVLFFFNSFYEKWYSLGLGLLVGAHCWVWKDRWKIPKGVQYAAMRHNLSPPFTRFVANQRS
jgi:hypothetical protein